MKLSLDIEADDQITPFLSRVARDIEGGRNVNGVNGFVARRVGEVVRAHVQREARVRHKTALRLGARPTGFLERGAEAIQSRPEQDGIIIDLPIPGMARAFRDVTIAARLSKWLTIPATGESYGRRARSFANLRFVPLGAGKAALMRTERRAGQKPENTVLFWLKKSVVQRQDRTLLPNDEELLQAAEDGAEEWLDNQEANRNERA